MNIFTERLNALIKENKITKKNLADAIGASKALVTIWTQGKSLPNLIYLKKIADFFCVCSDYLIGRQDWY